MFHFAGFFNEPLEQWDVSEVTDARPCFTVSEVECFAGDRHELHALCSKAYNKPLTKCDVTGNRYELHGLLDTLQPDTGELDCVLDDKMKSTVQFADAFNECLPSARYQ